MKCEIFPMLDYVGLQVSGHIHAPAAESSGREHPNTFGCVGKEMNTCLC
jgi:hypothetical protein